MKAFGIVLLLFAGCLLAGIMFTTVSTAMERILKRARRKNGMR